ncbi:MAG: hypothetical protein U9M98_00625 [Patescibacteria group bacterium]|nr:hypothetical protein [Patescibacteria group bacterium]
MTLENLNSKITKQAHAAISGGNIEEHLDGGWPFRNIGQLMNTALSTVIIVSGLVLLIYLIYGGFLYMTGQGNEERIEKAQRVISNAFIGLIIIISTFAIITVIEQVFGVSIVSGITLPRP